MSIETAGWALGPLGGAPDQLFSIYHRYESGIAICSAIGTIGSWPRIGPLLPTLPGEKPMCCTACVRLWNWQAEKQRKQLAEQANTPAPQQLSLF